MKINKGVFWIIVTLSLFTLLALPTSPAIADNTVSIGVTSTQVPESSAFIARVNIDSITNFDAAQYDITYDPAVIEVTDVTSGNIGGTTIPISSWGYIPIGVQGTIRVINNVDGTPGVSGSGYLAEIHFDVVGTSGATSSIDLHDGILGDKEAQEITPVTWTDGSVDVMATVAADFSADKTEVLINQAVTFTDTSSGGTPGYTYAWDFGDSSTSTEANPTHSYASPGNYTVSLTVTDSLGGSDTETETNYITVYAALVAGASTDIDEVAVGQTVTFNSGTTVGGKPGYTYAWDFGDSNTSTEANPSYSYAASGTHNVTLTVTDSLGNTDDITVSVTVYKLGDADKSGTVDILDITNVEHIIMGDSGYVYTTWADVNSSGSINALDITAIELIIMNP